MTVKWKTVFIGVIFALILSLTSGIILGTTGLFLSVIIASLVIGYVNNDNIITSAIHGAIFGSIGGFILGILILTGIGSIIGTPSLITLDKSTFIIDSIIIWAGLGVMGSAIGAMIIKKSPEMETRNKSCIELTIENIQKCACLECPIQTESMCAQNKIENMKEMMKIEKNMVLEPKNIPGMYCITQVTACNDFNTNKTCNCSNCNIFKENKLENSIGHFCRTKIAK
ncbi:DUF5518 domain-containing protein [Methanobacterium oryzae]|uniref:DUF5518 domain-containing protein n=1 Tax=Methanobacterium oryzae TaxID=69540 RepID=UPI003D1C8170